MRVLIADDQRSFATALADMVGWCGHEVVAVVGSGLEAIHAYTSLKPDLVLMDHWMPKLNGATACRHILAKDPAARVILISAWSPLDGADQSRAMSFLPKPVDLDRLNVTLHNIALTLPPPTPQQVQTPGSELPASGFVSIPQEIVSPIETFPVETFPLDAPVPVTGDESRKSASNHRKAKRSRLRHG